MLHKLEEILRERTTLITAIWTDIDGVHTRPGTVRLIGDREGSLVTLRDIMLPGGLRLVVAGDTETNLGPEYSLAQDEVSGSVELYEFWVDDGVATKQALTAGLDVNFISGRDSPCVHSRADKLGVKKHLGQGDKLAYMLNQLPQPWSHVLMLGDGVQDVAAMKAVCADGGLTVAPADAKPEAQDAAMYVSDIKGGEGVFAQAVKAVLQAQNQWFD